MTDKIQRWVDQSFLNYKPEERAVIVKFCTRDLNPALSSVMGSMKKIGKYTTVQVVFREHEGHPIVSVGGEES